jgi:hypothetical protein
MVEVPLQIPENGIASPDPFRLIKMTAILVAFSRSDVVFFLKIGLFAEKMCQKVLFLKNFVYFCNL